MNTTTFFLKYWHVNYLAVLIIIGIFIFHYITNGNRLNRKSQLIFIALILFGLVTISPLDYLSKSFLFSAHMIQHIVLLLIIPPINVKLIPYLNFHKLIHQKLQVTLLCTVPVTVKSIKNQWGGRDMYIHAVAYPEGQENETQKRYS